MIPLSDSSKTGKFPLFNLTVIAANIYVFYLMVTAANFDAFVMQYALVPSTVSFANPATLLPFVTSMFLHAGLFHLFSNMIFLWVFGDNIEGHFGKIWYVFIYLVSGIVGGLTQYMLDPSSQIPMLGASGAVSGILGAYIVSHPHSRIKSLFPLFIFITIVEIRAIWYILYWFGLQLLSGFASLNTATPDVGGVAFWAHIGGFVAGVILAKLGRKRYHADGVIEGEIIEK